MIIKKWFLAVLAALGMIAAQSGFATAQNSDDKEKQDKQGEHHAKRSHDAEHGSRAIERKATILTGIMLLGDMLRKTTIREKLKATNITTR